MGIFRIISWPFRKAFGWMGRNRSKVEAALQSMAAIIVMNLARKDLSGSEKFGEALRQLRAEAVRAGLSAADRILRRLIELEVVEQGSMPEGKTVEDIIDDGLQFARIAVMLVGNTLIAGDDERRMVAAARLRSELKRQGLEWLDVGRFLNLLIEYAVGVERGDFEEVLTK